MSVEMLNGKLRRKQLSDELDRFDGIIDALASGLGGHRRGAGDHPVSGDEDGEGEVVEQAVVTR